MVTINKRLYDTTSSGALYSAIAIFVLVFILIYSVILTASGSVGVTPRPEWASYLAYLFPQLGFLTAIVLFFVFTEATPKETYKGAKWQYFVIAIFLQFGLFSLSWANEWFVSVLNGLFGYQPTPTQIPSVDGGKIIPVILVIGVIPAVLEETVFRGLMLTPIKKFSTPLAVVISGALFALYHQSPVQTIYQFACGCAFALVTIRAGSVLPTIVSHFLNNAVVIILHACGVERIESVVFYVFSAIALVATLGYLIVFDKSGNEKKSESVKNFFLYGGIGIGLFALLWLSNLLTMSGVLQ